MPRKRHMNPKDEAKFYVTKGTDKAGLDVKYINPIKGRGVFSTVSFEKGEFILEYRGELISKQECESRQRLYHDSLKVFMFEFRFNGKLWCIDAAKEDGSLGRLVNDNHINPNATMKNLRVDGKPCLCLFALKSISPGEEIAYNYGDSDWPWRCKEAPSSETQPSVGTALSSSPLTEPGAFSAQLSEMATECNQNEAASHSGLGLVSSAEKEAPSSEIQPSVGTALSNSPLTEPGAFSAQLSEMATECNQNEAASHSGLGLVSSVEKMTTEKTPTLCPEKCQRHQLVCTTVSCLDKCLECTGSVSTFKWLGYKCTVCSGIWHKSCFKRFMDNQPKHSSREVSDSCYSEDELFTDKQDLKDNASDEDNISHSVSISGTDEDYVPDSESESGNGSDTSIQPPEEVSADFAVSSDAAATLNAENPSQEIPEVEKDVPAPTSVTMISKNYCYICGKPQSKISRHLKTHKKHSEIEHAFSFPARSKERRLLLERLRNKGNYQHNSDVLMNTTGSLKVRRKPRTGTKEISGKFIHCMYCKGMFVRKELWRHVRRCHCKPQGKDENPGRTKVLGLATHAESAYSQQISSGVWKLLGSMKQDEIASAVRNDFCIIQLAQSLYNKHGHDPTKYEYVRQKLREVGRFLLILRKESSIHSMEESVKPGNFHRVVQAVKKVSGYDAEKHCYHTPSLALKLGHTLQKISDIIHCRALLAEDGELIKSTEMFKKLYSCKWSELVSHTALNTLNNAKYNKPLTLPFTEDVKLLHRHLEKSANDAICSLKEAATPQNYAELAKITLAQIIVFNRRRAGEVSKMQLQSFRERDQTDLHEDVAMGLSQTEQKLCNYFCRIEIVGKRGRKVAVLLTPIMVDALSLLVSKRTECSVCDTNVFLFARPKSLSYYRGQDCLRIHASRCGAKNPEHLRSTQLRKHVATLSQVLNLKNNELDQLADFLGHDLRVHRDFYRLPVPTTQLAKISKLLLTMEKGQLSSVQGKSLDDIEIDGEIEVSDSEVDDKDESESEDNVSAITQSATSEPMVDASDCDHVAAVPESEIDASEDIGIDLVSSSNINERPIISEGSNASKGIDVSKKKKAWSKAEVAAVMKHFKNHVTRGKLATKNECLQCRLAEHPVLDGRTTQNIRDFVRNRGITFKRQSEKNL